MFHEEKNQCERIAFKFHLSFTWFGLVLSILSHPFSWLLLKGRFCWRNEKGEWMTVNSQIGGKKMVVITFGIFFCDSFWSAISIRIVCSEEGKERGKLEEKPCLFFCSSSDWLLNPRNWVSVAGSQFESILPKKAWNLEENRWFSWYSETCASLNQL